MKFLQQLEESVAKNTILINGKRHAVHNSKGLKIAESEAGLKKFYKWFGNSVVLDSKQRPMIVYPAVYAGEKRNKIFTTKEPSSATLVHDTDITLDDAHISGKTPFYLKIEKLFDTRHPECKKIFDKHIFKKVDSVKTLEHDLPRAEDAEEIEQFLNETYPEYDGVVVHDTGRFVKYISFKDRKSSIAHAEKWDGEKPVHEGTTVQAGFKTYLKEEEQKKVDSTSAGAKDVKGTSDVSFNLMRNYINTSGLSGASIKDYLEKAHDINDEIDTVCYGLETDDGQVVKVYVNAAQADDFETKMAAMLGTEDNVEDAINNLAQEFDIVDVVWPRDEEGKTGSTDTTDNEGEPDSTAPTTTPETDMTIDSSASLFADDEIPPEDAPEHVEPSSTENEPEKSEKTEKPEDESSTEDEPEHEDSEEPDGESTEKSDDEKTDDENDESEDDEKSDKTKKGGKTAKVKS
jgi:hypothetical protein